MYLTLIFAGVFEHLATLLDKHANNVGVFRISVLHKP